MDKKEIFQIDVDSMEWIDGTKDNAEDLCLHGSVSVQMGDYKNRVDCTVSAAALYLLKTLSRNHEEDKEIQLLPCCGHAIISKEADENGEICDVLPGCDYGLDWSVMHDGDFVRLIVAGEEKAVVPFEQYKMQVFQFADKVSAFYDSAPPRYIHNDFKDLDYKGFMAFKAEWKMHYEKWNMPCNAVFPCRHKQKFSFRRYSSLVQRLPWKLLFLGHLLEI